MYTTVNERFRMIAEKLYNGNITAMAKATYISRTMINSIIGEKEVAPGYEVIRKIAEISSPKISLDWLITGAGEMLVNTTQPDKNISVAQNNTLSIVLKKISYAMCPRTFGKIGVPCGKRKPIKAYAKQHAL